MKNKLNPPEKLGLLHKNVISLLMSHIDL